MRILAGLRTRLFLICWLGFSLHFSTNVVREHYPAFTLIDQGNFQLDEYLGFHADIFEHTDGHAYIGNQVAGSLPAVPALLIFDPLLDRLEEYSKRKITESTTPVATHYDTEYPNRGGFLKLVTERGLDLRFGAATVITSVFCMAPLAAWLVLMLFMVLRRRGVSEARSVTLALLFAFATPVLYRASHLNHNLF
ncbi:MAG: hypothetical protein KDB53_07765, partial [Planctomycetes bacterium]|nr:hypothetical protein [Planctomycetota bacterium]